MAPDTDEPTSIRLDIQIHVRNDPAQLAVARLAVRKGARLVGVDLEDSDAHGEVVSFDENGDAQFTFVVGDGLDLLPAPGDGG